MPGYKYILLFVNNRIISMKFFLFVLFLVNISANESKIKYDGYIVYRLMPFTNEQLEELKLLAESDSGVRTNDIFLY